MQFTLNELDTNSVRTDTFRGDEYLVAPVTAMKAMDLHKGYVPKKEVKKSVPAWNGTPVTLFHPANEHGDRVSANSPHVAEKVWLGYMFNAEAENDGETLNGEVWIDVKNAESKGGLAQEVVEKLENGEEVPVSTAYFGDELPSGEYDGQERQDVIGNLRPDHFAMLPGKDGRCSVEDGCMAGEPAVNSEDLDVNIDELEFEEVDTSTDDPVEPGEDENIGKALVNAVRNYINREDNMDRNEMITVLSNEHGFKEESLEGMGDTCLERTYESFNEEEVEEEEEEEEVEVEETEETEPETSEDDGITQEDISEMISEQVQEAIAANEKSQRKSELIDQILDNSDDYEEDTLEETPEEVLENMADEVTTDEKPAANWSGSVGARESPTEEHENFDLPTIGDE